MRWGQAPAGRALLVLAVTAVDAVTDQMGYTRRLGSTAAVYRDSVGVPSRGGGSIPERPSRLIAPPGPTSCCAYPKGWRPAFAVGRAICCSLKRQLRRLQMTRCGRRHLVSRSCLTHGR